MKKPTYDSIDNGWRLAFTSSSSLRELLLRRANAFLTSLREIVVLAPLRISQRGDKHSKKLRAQPAHLRKPAGSTP
jgi:hypothetical protein